jgi:hypothetical protein
MADKGFNGTTVSVVGTSAVPLLDASNSSSGAKVQVSGSGDSQKEYVTGVPDNVVTLTVAGCLDIDVGDTGATTVTWNDGTTDTYTSSIVTDVNATGSEDSPITQDISVAPTPAA